MLAPFLAAAFALAPAQVASGELAKFPELGLELTLPALESLAAKPIAGEQLKGRWSGKLGASEVEIKLLVLASGEFHFSEPEDVTDLAEENRAGDAPGKPFEFSTRELVAGAFGYAPYASLCVGEVASAKSDVKSQVFALGGVLERYGYFVEVLARPAPAADAAKTLRAFLEKGVRYEGRVRDPAWSDEEVRARWEEFSPPDAIEKTEKPIRTEHYVVMSNSSGAKAFAKKMEEFYAQIRKVYPFDEVAGRRRMPVFLFRSADQYYAYYQKIANVPLEEAAKSKGHAWRDYYATWYEAPNDPVHIHEGTHQVFANRLRLSGGGSWFQEGVAEYISTKPNDRNDIARVVKSGKHVPLAEFVKIDSLISAKEDVRGGGGAGGNYSQAALLIEFLHESEFARAKFSTFLQRVGRLERNSSALEETLRGIYGVDLKGLDEQFVRYCKER